MAKKRLPAGFTEKKDGRLQLAFTVDGKRYVVCGHTKQECQAKEQKKRQAIAQGLETRARPTLLEYANRWHEKRDLKVSTATQRTQEHIIRMLCAVPVKATGKNLGEMKLKDIQIDDLEEVQRLLLDGWRPASEKAMKNAHKTDRKRSTQCVNDYMALLRHILKDAKKERLIDFNPAESVDNLKRTEERCRDTKHRALTRKEQEAFFSSDVLGESAYCRIFKFAALTGMRCGEIGALQRRDIRKGFIHVERTITRKSAGYYIGDSAKTAAGKRKIPLTAEIDEVLKEQYKVNAMLYGNAVSPNDTIFRAPMGGLLQPTPADREIKRICRDAGIKPFTMHGFRATFATRCIEAGMNPRTLQELLGHSNFNLTMSLYGHVVEDTLTTEMEKVRISV